MPSHTTRHLQTMMASGNFCSVCLLSSLCPGILRLCCHAPATVDPSSYALAPGTTLCPLSLSKGTTGHHPSTSAGDGSSKALLALRGAIVQPVPHSVVPSLLSSSCVVFTDQGQAPVLPLSALEESHMLSCFSPLPLHTCLLGESLGFLLPMA